MIVGVCAQSINYATSTLQESVDKLQLTQTQTQTHTDKYRPKDTLRQAYFFPEKSLSPSNFWKVYLCPPTILEPPILSHTFSGKFCSPPEKYISKKPKEPNSSPTETKILE